MISTTKSMNEYVKFCTGTKIITKGNFFQKYFYPNLLGRSRAMPASMSLVLDGVPT